jgi:tRNA(fMet)-specific endonuclease VapC
VTLGEIAFGHKLVPKPNVDAQRDYENFLSSQFPFVVSIDRHTVEYYAILRAKLFQKFAPKNKRPRWIEQLQDPISGRELGIQENDLWLAAQAVQYNLVFVTNDRLKKIRGIESDLLIEDWASSM